MRRRIRRAARALGLLVPRRGLAARGARRAGGRARLRRVRAHRPRRGLRVTRVRLCRQAPRAARDHRRGGHARGTAAHVTLLCETRRGYENLCRILTDAHARTRPEGRERDLLPAGTSAEVVAEHAEGLVCLSGCARNGLAVTDPNGAAALARAFPGAFYVELQRPYERGDARRNARPDRACGRARRPDRRDRRRPRSPSTPQPAPGRPRRDPQPHLARRLRARAARQPRIGAPLPGGDRRTASGRRRRPDARDRRPLHLRPDRGARLPLPRLLRRAQPGRQPAARALRARVRRPLRQCQRAQEARPRPPRDRAGADRPARPRRVLPAPLGGARAGPRLRARGARTRLAAQRPAAGAGERLERRLDRLLPHRPVTRRPGRGEPLARALPQRRAGLGARHRPRLPAGHPREADRRRHRALRPRARRARRDLLDLPQPRRDPRRRQGARAPVRRARTARPRHRRLAGNRCRRRARRTCPAATRAHAGRPSAS